MSDWVIRDAVREDEPCLASMWLKSYAHSRDIRETGLANASVDGHPDEVRFWRIHQPIVTMLLRSGTVKVACDPQRSTYTAAGPAIIMAWSCSSPGRVHWVGIKRHLNAIDGLSSDIFRDLRAAAAIADSASATFDLMDLRKQHLGGWRYDRGWLSALRSVSTRVLDEDRLFLEVNEHLVDRDREAWTQNSGRAA